MKKLLTLFLFGLLWTASGCKTVQPYERGTLADYTMRADRDPLDETLREHIYFTREAAAGAGSGVNGRS